MDPEGWIGCCASLEVLVRGIISIELAILRVNVPLVSRSALTRLVASLYTIVSSILEAMARRTSVLSRSCWVLELWESEASIEWAITS
jgi:hypothetical protein